MGRPSPADGVRRAQLDDWYVKLSEGLDTPVGRHGGAVSGGERQQLGVARTLLADRPVLVLDEPTAHLDPSTASALADEVMRLTAGGTALLVTHHPEQTPGVPRIHLCRAPEAHGSDAAQARRCRQLGRRHRRAASRRRKTPKITEVLLLHLHRLSRPGDHARQDAYCDIHCRLVDAGDRREKSLVGLDNHRPREVSCLT
jgi:hypothetical protein